MFGIRIDKLGTITLRRNVFSKASGYRERELNWEPLHRWYH